MFLTNSKIRLIQLSFLMLFVELTLIRWVGSNLYYLFFFANFILLASFLGIGLGFLRKKSSESLFKFSPILLSIIIVFCYLFCYQYQAQIDPATDNLNYFASYFKNNLYPVWLTLPIVFLMVVTLMTAIADEVSREFLKFSPLQAYRLEILGSLLGVFVFSLISFLSFSPLTWGMVIFFIYLTLLANKRISGSYWMTALQVLMLLIMIVIFAKETLTPQHFWSPYYKIELQEYAGKRYLVNVNGLAQQIIESVEQRKKVKPFYFLPYQYVAQNRADNMLVIGAGTGGDVAIALAQGAKHVDAVEIDPTLYQLGRQFNPNRPYHDSRVRTFVDDGRAFLQQTNNKYDMIIFALTDSLMLIPGQSSLRLENYLYTLEGLMAAKQKLKPDGTFVIYNHYGAKWFVDRLANTLKKVYGHYPCIDTYSPKDYWATVITINQNKNALLCKMAWKPTEKNYQTPATDNHPFIYLQGNTIPPLYIVTLFFILLVSLGSMKVMGISYASIKNNLDLFFMGAAFLLLETKNIINFALFFGTTWLVNAFVFIGILFTVYLSIEIRMSKIWIKLSSRLLFYLYVGLISSILLSWLIPSNYLLSLPILLRFILAATLAFTPILIANLIFTDRFQSSIHSADAFGANIIGAVMGGLLEYTALITGYQNLLLVIIFLYALAIARMLYTTKVELITR